MKRLFVLLSVLIIASLVLVACPGRGTPAPKEAAPAATEAPAAPAAEFTYEDPWGVVVVKKGEPIKLGFAAGLSGAGIDVLGIDEQRGAELAVQDAGEVFPGFPIQLEVEDSLCTGEGGTAVANKFVADPQIVAVVGHMCSSSCIPASDIYEASHYTMLSPSCTAVAFTTRGLAAANRVAWNDAIQGPAAAQFIKDTLGFDRIATIHDGSPYGEGLVDEMAKAFEALGGTIVAREAINVGDTDMRPVLTKIKSANPQLIYFGGFVAEGAFLASQRADVGMEDVVFMGADGIKANDFIKAAGDAAEGVYASAANPAEAGPGLEDFLAKYEATYGEKPPAPFNAHAYDAVMVYVNAIKQVGKIDPDGNLHIGRKALNDAVRATKDYQGLSGKISCDEKGDCGTGTVAIFVVKNGEWVEAGAPAPEEVAAAPAPGGTFIFGRGGDSVQLDPAIVTDGESFRVTGQCLEPLYQYEPGSTKPIPALATECTPNEDSTEWTCKLRQGVKFHDGTDFNADAVIFNFERWRFTDNPYHFESQVFEYYEYMWGGFDDASFITEVQKIDDYTVKFVLSESLAPFLANLAMDMFAISSPAAIEKYGEDYGTPEVGCVGTGPFKFKEWVEGDHITVVANEDYWNGRPKVDEVVWRVIPDDSARFLALKAGDIHALEQATAEDVAAAEADPDLYVLTRPALNTGYLAFNYRIKEFQDKRVREAVAHAINKKGLVENFYGPYGEVATNFLPPLVWGHNDKIEDWAYDPELSKQLLAEAGFPDGLSEVTIAEDILDSEGNVVYAAGQKIPLKLYYMPVTRFYYPSPKEIGEAMAADLAKAGINAQLELAGDWPTYLGLRRNGLLVGLYMLGWGGDNGDPDNFHNYFFGFGGSDKVGPPDQWVKSPDPREGFYANTEVARLLYQAAINPNQAERQKIYEHVEELLHEDVARIWIVHNNTPLLFSKKVSGYVPQPVGADYYEWVVVEQ